MVYLSIIFIDNKNNKILDKDFIKVYIIIALYNI